MRAVWVAACLAVATAGSAGAAPKPKCAALTDEKGDVYAASTVRSVKLQDDALDLLGATIAVDAKTAVFTVKVAKLDVRPATSPQGGRWFLLMQSRTLPGIFEIRAISDATGQTFEAGYRPTTTPDSYTARLERVSGVLDTGRGEVRITAPMSAFGPTAFRPGHSLIVTVRSARELPPAGFQSDDFGPFEVAIGKPSCVKGAG